MTTYQVTSEGDGHQLVASWPDLPERADHPVASFKELKLATAARNVLSAASRYRWHRWIQLQDQGIFTEERSARTRPTRRGARSSRQVPESPFSRPGYLGCRRTCCSAMRR